MAKYPTAECSGEGTPEASGKFEVVIDDGATVHSKDAGDGQGRPLVHFSLQPEPLSSVKP
jgi:hypothetical protein